MLITNAPTFNPHPVTGGNPELFWGTTAPDALSTFTTKQIGTIYDLIRSSGTGYGVTETWLKVANNGLVSDWSCTGGFLTERLSVTTMTDGGSTVGTQVLTSQLPAGAFSLGSAIKDVVGFAGDTTAIITIGDGSDVDRYNTSSFNVFATAAIPASVLTQNAPSGNRGHTAAQAITATVTSSTDFTLVKTNASGRCTIVIAYIIP